MGTCEKHGGFGKDGLANRRRRASIRKPAGLRRRTRVGGAAGACGHAGAAAAGGEEHHVRHVGQPTRRPRFDFRERVLVVDYGHRPRTSFTRCIWRCRPSGSTDGCTTVVVEPARRSSGAFLDRVSVFLVTKINADMDGYIVESLVPPAGVVSAMMVHGGQRGVSIVDSRHHLRAVINHSS